MMQQIILRVLAACSLTLNPIAAVLFVQWLIQLKVASVAGHVAYMVTHRGPPDLLRLALVLSILGVVSTFAYLVLSGLSKGQNRSTAPRVLSVMAILAINLPAVITIPASLWQLPASEEQARLRPPEPKKPGINKLLGDLSDEDYMVRHEAAKGLASEANIPESAIPKLLAAAERNEGETSIYAIDALKHFPNNSEDVLPGLAALLGEREIGRWAAEALGGYGKPGVDALLEASRSKKWRARESAAHGLGKADYFEQEIVVRLTELLRDEEASVRAAAANSLYKFGVNSESALPLLESMANDPDPKVRVEAERTTYEINRQLGSQNP